MGNVLMDFNPDYMLSVFLEDIDEIQYFKQIIFYSDIWKKLDHGSLSFDQAYTQLQEIVPLEKRNKLKTILDRWPETKYPRKDMEQIIKRLKENGYNIYLCSNCNSLFHTYKDKYSVFKHFDGFVISGDILMSKPEIEIYLYLLKQFNLDPKTCLFVDDIKENILGANKVGIDGYHYNGNGKMFESYLENIHVFEK